MVRFALTKGPNSGRVLIIKEHCLGGASLGGTEPGMGKKVTARLTLGD
jgi:hypothetical protein